MIIITSEGSKSSTHYLGDKNRFDVSSKGPLLYTGHVLIITSNILVTVYLQRNTIEWNLTFSDV